MDNTKIDRTERRNSAVIIVGDFNIQLPIKHRRYKQKINKEKEDFEQQYKLPIPKRYV